MAHSQQLFANRAGVHAQNRIERLDQRFTSNTKPVGGSVQAAVLKLKASRRSSRADIAERAARKQRTVFSAAYASQSSAACQGHQDRNVAIAEPPIRIKLLFPQFMRACTLALVVAGVAWAGIAMASHAASGSGPSASSNLVSRVFNFVMHLDTHLTDLIAQHGSRGVYGVLFGIVFAETGLVITPFLPGDSLLFAAGCLPALNFWALLGTFITAASLGDAFNYMIGSTFGKKALKSNFVKGDYVAKTEKFYSKHGVKTIILARFVPIVRTFAPFVAGIASMDYTTFAIYNVGGAVLWSVLLTGLGRAFGQLPIVQNNFSAVCAAIVVISLVPVLIEAYIAHKEAISDGDSLETSTT